MTRCVRVVGRLSGDEFAIYLPETDYQGAKILFEKLREDLAQDSLAGGWPIGFSIGVAVFPDISASLTIDNALKIADELMYRIKNTGKNSIVYEVQGVSELTTD